MDSITALFVDDETDFTVSIIKRMRQRNVIAYGAASGAPVFAAAEGVVSAGMPT